MKVGQMGPTRFPTTRLIWLGDRESSAALRASEPDVADRLDAITVDETLAELRDEGTRPIPVYGTLLRTLVTVGHSEMAEAEAETLRSRDGLGELQVPDAE